MSYVVPQFITETYPNEIVFLAEHVSDAASIAWNETRANLYALGYIPSTVFGCDPDYFGDYPGVPPTPWIDRVEAQRAKPTDLTMTLSTHKISANDWRFTAQVCMEPEGTARTVRVNIGYTIDDYPVVPPVPRYLATVRSIAPYEDLAFNPGDCLDVERTFTFQQIDLDHWETIVGVAWAQTPNTGFGEQYQATKNPFLLLADGFESGDLAGWTVAVP